MVRTDEPRHKQFRQHECVLFNDQLHLSNFSNPCNVQIMLRYHEHHILEQQRPVCNASIRS